MPKVKQASQTRPAAVPAAIPWWMRKRLMRIVFAALFVIGCGIMAYPYLPLIRYQLFPPKSFVSPYASRLDTLPTPGEKNTARPTPEKPKPSGNRLVIPKIGVDIQVVEGENDKALLKGAWRVPGTSDSPTASNMVLSAHRFRYRPPSSETFYLLNKLVVGDTFMLYWNNQEFDYRVSETKEVTPDAVQILNPTTQPIVTLFTCTPLFSTTRRLVVIGTPITTN